MRRLAPRALDCPQREGQLLAAPQEADGTAVNAPRGAHRDEPFEIAAHGHLRGAEPVRQPCDLHLAVALEQLDQGAQAGVRIHVAHHT